MAWVTSFLFCFRFLHKGFGRRRGEGGMRHYKGRSLCPGKALAHFAGIVRRKGALSVQLLVPIG